MQILWRVGVQFDDNGKETQFFQVVSENTLNCLAANLDEASASKIVTALNSHQALVEAMELCLKALGTYGLSTVEVSRCIKALELAKA